MLRIDELDVERFRDQLRANDKACAFALSERGWCPAVLEACEVGIDAAGRFTLPYRDEAGALVGFARYEARSERRNGGTPKLIAERGSRRQLFPPPERVSERPGEWLFLAEGEPDTLCLLSCGLAAVGVPGVGGWQPEWRERFRGARLCIVLDCDPQGRKAAQRIAADLAGVAADVRVLDLDPQATDGYDATDFLRGAKTASEREQARRLLLRCAEAAPRFASPLVPDDAAATPFALDLDEFVVSKTEEPVVLVGTEDNCVLPQGGFLFLAGKAGVGKTTLAIDFAFHLAAGIDWLGIAVPRPLNVLLIENEGPREPFRGKLEHKREVWTHSLLGSIRVVARHAPRFLP